MRVPAELARASCALIGRTLLTASAPVHVQRAATSFLARAMIHPREVAVSRPRLPLSGEWLRPAEAEHGSAMLYLHGGGYVVGSARTHRGLVGRLAHLTGVPALALDYRRAPEHPYPAALRDARQAHRQLLDDGFDPARIALVGDSAGAGLALALAMELRDREEPLPAVIGLICPWLDLVPDLGRSRQAAPREPLLTPALLHRWGEAYVGDRDPTDPLISPLHGELAGLPPLVVHSAGDDPLRVDSEQLVIAGGRYAGTEIEHRRYEGLWHDFHVYASLIAEADDAVADMAALLRTRLKSAVEVV